LPIESSDLFIKSLVNHSNFVLFSAAIPNQGGTYHINEQWQDYWVEKFKNNNFLPVDFLRNKLWAKKEIDWWYKQNIILFVKKDALEENNDLKNIYLRNLKPSYNFVHPELYFINNGITTSFKRAISKPVYTFNKFINFMFN